jgi:hypothetical protein
MGAQMTLENLTRSLLVAPQPQSSGVAWDHRLPVNAIDIAPFHRRGPLVFRRLVTEHVLGLGFISSANLLRRARCGRYVLSTRSLQINAKYADESRARLFWAGETVNSGQNLWG